MELLPADLIWTQNGPQSRVFNDIYFSAEDGPAETEHVFLQANRLQERFAAQAEGVTISETGFGTGLNLLSVLSLWRSMPFPRPRLHYITTELYPLTLADIEKAQVAWPEWAWLAAQLRAIYPPAVTGAHRRWLFDGEGNEDGEVCVDFLWGDAAKSLFAYQPLGGVRVDCWFLDGFSPAQNPQMWTPKLFASIAALSGPGTSLSSFTVAGDVRRGLEAAGFKIEKASGFGRKREMLKAEFTRSPAQKTVTPASRVLVIGAGIAGVSTAWQLAKRGCRVIMIDAGADICASASGSPASAFTPFYQPDWSARARMLTAGFFTTDHILNSLHAKGHVIEGQRDGMLMLDMPDKSQRCERFSIWQHSLDLPDDIRKPLEANEMSELAGIDVSCAGWLYLKAGWLNLRSLADAMLADAAAQIELRLSCKATALNHNGQNWQVTLEAPNKAAEKMPADIVVLACAASASNLLQGLELSCVHGQTLSFEAPPAFKNLQRPLNCGHTLLPNGKGKLSWGASFRHKINAPHVLPEETERLLDEFKTFFNQEVSLAQTDIEVWAGLRCTHPSRMPLIGAVPAQPEGLYMHLAHGARGSLTASLMMARALYEI